MLTTSLHFILDLIQTNTTLILIKSILLQIIVIVLLIILHIMLVIKQLEINSSNCLIVIL